MKEITVNVSSFVDIRTKGDYIYVDKTRYVYNLVKSRLNNYYFISRPRRYGKSLMCSTLHSLFEGKRELFRGLYIDKTDYSFEKYPVFHFNFAKFNTTSYNVFLSDFQEAIISEAERNGIRVESAQPSSMLNSVFEKTEKEIVIIVDEYDIPIIHTYKNEELSDAIKEVISSFYSVIKNTNEKVRFFFLTGITKFSNLSIFSQMNNLTDLTFSEKYASMFGYTEEEMLFFFSDYIDQYMRKEDREYERRDDFIEAIRDYYDGYRFSYRSEEKVYNPVSVGKFFSNDCHFEPYWIETGASTLAINLAKDYHLGRIVKDNPIIGFDAISTFDYTNLASHSLDNSQVLALIYFTGYLTIKEGTSDALTLTFPNSEVRTAFTKSLMKLYVGVDVASYVENARLAIKTNNLLSLINTMNAYYEKIPYVVLSKEIGYESMFYAFFILMGVEEIKCEEATSIGRIDVVITTKTDVYVIEIKVNQSSDKALNQIKEKRYYAKYINSDRQIHIVGLNFSSRSKKISSWKEEIIDKTKEPSYIKG